jgi:hypothetical protein
MPGVKYFIRQANAFLSLAQSNTDEQLRARYRMMAQRYRDMASDSSGWVSAGEPAERPGAEND